MQRAHELNRKQLEQIVDELQRAMYLREEEMVFDPKKELGGADFIDAVTDILVLVAPGIIPDEETPLTASPSRGYFFAPDNFSLLVYLVGAIETYPGPLTISRWETGFRVEGMEMTEKEGKEVPVGGLS